MKRRKKKTLAMSHTGQTATSAGQTNNKCLADEKGIVTRADEIVSLSHFEHLE